MWRVLQSLLGVMILAAAARASPFWIRYDAADGLFPEQQSWERVIYPPPAERWLEDGALVIDSRASIYTADYYRWSFPGGGLYLQPGDRFLMRWRLKVDEVINHWDVCAEVISDDMFTVTFLYGYDYLFSVFEGGASASFAPGVFHTYELRSSDMRTYELRIDDELALSGSFAQHVAFPPARVVWGDDGLGTASLTRWSYYEFGVVTPEPGTALTFLLGLLGVSQSQHRRRCVLARQAAGPKRSES